MEACGFCDDRPSTTDEKVTGSRFRKRLVKGQRSKVKSEVKGVRYKVRRVTSRIEVLRCGRTPLRTPARIVAAAAALLISAAAVVVTGICFYVVMFSSFADYDDEGTIMIAVQSFVEGRALYTEISTQTYGPLPFLVARLVYGLSGAPVSHDATRLLTMAFGIAAAALVAFFVYSVTKSFAFALLTYLQGLLLLGALANEPGHPQGLLVVLVAAILAASARPLSNRSIVILGISSAATLLTKINAGVYTAAPVVMALLVASSPTRWIRRLQIGLGIGLSLLPFAVMRMHLATWGLYGALLVSATTAATCVTVRRRLADPVSPATVTLYAAAAAIFAALVVGATILAGTPFDQQLEGVLFSALRFVGMFEVPWDVSSGDVTMAMSALAMAVALSATRVASTRGLRLALKVAFAIAVWIAAAWHPTKLVSLAPFVWVVALPLADESERVREAFPRALLCLMGACQLLIAYPVAGSQQTWALWLLIPAAAVSAADALQSQLAVRSGVVRAAAHIALLVGMFYVYAPRYSVHGMQDQYAARPSLDLPGARRVHVEPQTAAKYQRAVAWIRRDCDSLLSLPGLNSLYFWSQKAPPTHKNPGAWMTLLDDAAQREKIDRVASDLRACVVRDRAIAEFWNQGRDVSHRPLVRFIDESFHTVAMSGSLELMVRNDRNWEPAEEAAARPASSDP